ncbi:MAG: DUF1415 domain-containing protein [Burkholderiaceae bacterium]|nr:DUF1415 domain-containing protein [Burkholderiaceae bacterium]
MHSSAEAPTPEATLVIAAMQQWLERAVIGLNLCPFAKAVHVKQQIHYVVYQGDDAQECLALLRTELRDLAEADPEVHDTTLLIAPRAWSDFLDFNDFLDQADRVLRKAKLDGVLQIASFHPQFQFADSEPDALSNYTNRAPFPTLHLLREASIDRAVQAFPNAESIFEKNIETLERLGHAGWDALGLRSTKDPS